MSDPIADILARVIQEHRVQPRTHACSCGWKAERGTADPMYLQYLRHGADEQAKALRARGLVGVSPEWIRAQRDSGWPDMHPEDYCHRCGAPNMSWFTDRETWLAATSAWAAETGREGICCPQCLALMHHEATGVVTFWHLSGEATA